MPIHSSGIPNRFFLEMFQGKVVDLLINFGNFCVVYWRSVISLLSCLLSEEEHRVAHGVAGVGPKKRGVCWDHKSGKPQINSLARPDILANK